jgi:hypothetical protein
MTALSYTTSPYGKHIWTGYREALDCVVSIFMQERAEPDIKFYITFRTVDTRQLINQCHIDIDSTIVDAGDVERIMDTIEESYLTLLGIEKDAAITAGNDRAH